MDFDGNGKFDAMDMMILDSKTGGKPGCGCLTVVIGGVLLAVGILVILLAV